MKKAEFEIVFEQVNDPEVAEDTVTAAVSLYNYAEFLPETLDSLRDQRHPPLDLIVVDDASTEESSVRVARDWLAAHAGRFGRASLLRHTRNQGLAEARNTAFHYARSDLVFVIDADDLIYPRAIGRLVQAIRDTGFGAAYTQLEYFGSERKIGLADVFDAERLKLGNYIDATSLISKWAWQQVGGYTHIEGGWEDYDLWCKFAEQDIAAAYVPEILCRYRQHPKSMVRTESIAATKTLQTQVLLRHPWLQLLKLPASTDSPPNTDSPPPPRSLEPASRMWGFDRGKPIDRHYIEAFLEEHQGDIRGRVAEIGDRDYTTKFGGAEVRQSDVLNVEAGYPETTLVVDLATGAGIPADAFDCMIMTQTLQFVFDVRGAVSQIHKALKPGAVALVTVPGISQTTREDMERWGDLWRFTDAAMRRLFGDVFGPENVTVAVYGNVLAACAFVQGLAVHELTLQELDHCDPDYQVIIAVRAVRAGEPTLF